MIVRLSLLLMFMALISSGTEFFVSPSGNNNNRGTSADQPYETLKRAADMMKPGDTMTLLPGEYRQGLEWEFPGGDAVTTIRAAIPGTVVLRGDFNAPEFKQSPMSPRVWQCRLPQVPQAINERDTLRNYERMPSVAELDFNAGSWFYDETEKMLYIHTGDSEPPFRHYITISDIRGHGIMVNSPNGVRNITIEGLIITGFNANSRGGLPGHNAKWGVYLVSPKNCTIRNVTTFLNGSGIGFSARSNDNVIEDCRSYANQSLFYGSGGNIIVLTPSEKTAIRRCISFGSIAAGIRFYGGEPAQYCIFEDNISFDNGYGDMWLKYPSDTTTARRCVAGEALYSRLIENCLFNYGDTVYFGAARNSIIRTREKGFDENREFADPMNYDYRPQADSGYRNRAPAIFSGQVFYIKNDGNNDLDGNSVKNAWHSLDGRLKDGATYYLLPGQWRSDINLKNLKNVTIRGRGVFPVKLNGGITIENCENIVLERLIVSSMNVSNSRQTRINQCAVSDINRIKQSESFRLTHCVFNGIQLVNSTGGYITGNIFAKGNIVAANSVYWSDFNSYAGDVPDRELHSFTALPELNDKMTLNNGKIFEGRSIDGMPVGPFRRQPLAVPLKLDGPELLSCTGTTANIEFWSNYPVTGTIFYGTNEACVERYDFNTRMSFQSMSLTRLKPKQKYFFKVKAKAIVGKHFSNHELEQKQNSMNRVFDSTVKNFTTCSSEAEPKVYHVSVDGNDGNPGTLEKPWRNISYAAHKATAGDTILVHHGTYKESIRVRATGDEGRPLRISAAPGERVWIDGNVRQLNYGFAIFNKNHVVIDGFYFREIRQLQTGINAGITLMNSNRINISRCFYDGRSHGYTPYFIRANDCSEMTVANCFATRAFHGALFTECRNLLIRNCVFYINQINSCTINNKPGQKVVLRNNIWIDNTLQKVGNPIINLSDISVLEEYDNCYFLRVPKNEKTLFGYNRFKGKDLPMSKKSEVLERQWRRQGRFGREMATYEDFLNRTGSKSTAVFVDPQFKALPEFIRFKNLVDWELNFPKLSKQHNEKEYHWRNGKYEPLEFDDFFARNPELLKRKTGLESDVFKK